MGLFDWLMGKASVPVSAIRQPVAVLRQNLLAINRDTAPFVVRDGAPEGVDLVAEWKIVDARWYEIFAAAGLEKVFRILIKFDDAKGEVRSLDEEWSVEWRAGVPSLTLSGEAFRGQKFEISFGAGYAFREDLSYGKVYQYAFKTSEMKDPLIEAAANSGWNWRGVAFGRL